MNQIYPDEGLLEFLERAVAGDFIYHLFTNDIEPGRDTELDDLDEAAWTGYVPVTVEAADFELEGVAGHIGTKIAPPIEFPNDSGDDKDAFGYYVTDVGETMLMMIGRFDDAPQTVETGESFVVIPTISDYSEFEES